MARPRSVLPAAEHIHALVDAQGRLCVRVTPGARTESLAVEGETLLARVRAKPQDGQANLAVLALIAMALDLPPSRLELVRGATSREKLFRILP